METIELGNETTITNIGTFEWNMEDGGVLYSHLKFIRPTVDKDIGDKDALVSKSYALNSLRISKDEDIKMAFTYVINAALRHLHDDEVTGKVLLVLAKKQQRWDVMIQCNAYKASP